LGAEEFAFAQATLATRITSVLLSPNGGVLSQLFFKVQEIAVCTAVFYWIRKGGGELPSLSHSFFNFYSEDIKL
jgi:hypothetical protein